MSNVIEFKDSYCSREKWVKLCEFSHIPQHMQHSLIGYILHGARPSEFLFNVLCNNFVEAAIFADHINLKALHKYSHFLFHHAPGKSWGSEELVNAWCESGGLEADMKKFYEEVAHG